MTDLEGLGAIWARLWRHGLLRAVLPFALVGGGLLWLLDAWGTRTLDSTGSVLLDAFLMPAYIGGLLFIMARAARRGADAERGVLRASEHRFRNLTRLSADWFWETDAEHRIRWISGGAQISALLGERSVYGMRMWEVPDIEFMSGALATHSERLEARLPFFDLELAAIGASGEKYTHALSGEPMLGKDGTLLGYRGVARDVSLQRRAEQALGRAKERLDLAVAGGNLAVWDVDIAHGVVYLDEGWARLLGREARSGGTLPLEALFETIHPQDRQGVQDAYFGTLKAARSSYSVEYRVLASDSSWRWVHSTGRVTARDVNGRAMRLSGVAVDIEARKRAEQGLKEMEQRYRSLSEVSPDAILVHSNGVIEYANPAAARLFKAGTPRALLGLRIAAMLMDEGDPRARERMKFLSLGPGVVPFEERTMRATDGSVVRVEVAAVSYLESGRLLVQSVLRDVSELRRARASASGPLRKGAVALRSSIHSNV